MKLRPAHLILVVAVLLLLYMGGRSGLPTCTFPPGGGSCSHTLLLPENRSYASLAFNLTPTAAPGATTTYAAQPVITEIHGLDYQAGGRVYAYAYLYALPDTTTSAYDVIATVTDPLTPTSGGCTPRILTLYRVTYANPTHSIDSCQSQDIGPCNSADMIDYGKQGHATDAYFTYLTPALEEVASTSSPTGSDLIVTATLGTNQLFSPPSSTTFVVGTRCNATTSRLDEIGDVTFAVRPAQYPTNLALKLNSATLTTLNGVQETTLRTPDVATPINTACGRPTSAGACTIYLTWTSTTAGTLSATDDALLQVITGTTTNTTNTSNYTVTNTTICGTCTATANVTCGTCGTTTQTPANTTTCGLCPSTAANTTCGTCASQDTVDDDWLQAVKSVPAWAYVALVAILVTFIYLKTRRRR